MLNSKILRVFLLDLVRRPLEHAFWRVAGALFHIRTERAQACLRGRSPPIFSQKDREIGRLTRFSLPKHGGKEETGTFL